MKQEIGSNVLGLIKFLCISFVVTMLVLVILAFMLWKVQISERIVNGGIIFSYIFSCFLGGMMFAGRKQSKRFLWGGVLGLCYFFVVVVVSMAINRQLFTAIPGMLTVFFLCVLGGMLGGMVKSSGG